MAVPPVREEHPHTLNYDSRETQSDPLRLTFLALFVFAAGLTAGAFLSRLLSESFYTTLGGLSRWPWIMLLAGAGGLTAVSIWALAVRFARRYGRSANQAKVASVVPCIPLFLLALYLFPDKTNLLQGWTLFIGALTLAVLLAGQSALRFNTLLARWADRLLPAGLVLMTLALYLRTLSPTIGQADSFEFQVVAYKLGVAHPTGYPLYILLGKMFTFLPIGDIAYRVNLISPIGASLAALFLFLFVRRLIRSRWAALCSAFTFAFAQTLWSQAVIAEVYTLNVLFVVLILYLLLRWRDGHTASLRLLAFVLGLSLTNHLTMVLLLPPVSLFILWTEPEILRRGRLWLVLLGLFLLGLAVDLYIPLRWPALHQGRPMRLDEFIAWITGQQFSGALRWDAWLRDPERYGILVRLSLAQYGIPGLLLGLLGLAWLLARHPREGLTLLLAYLTYSFYGLNYYVPDVSVFLIPAQAVHTICIGIGVWTLADLSGRLSRSLCTPAAVWTLAMSLPLSLVWMNLPVVDRSDDWSSRRWGEAVLRLPIAPNAAILADSDKIAPLYYLTQVEGLRSDLDCIVRGDEAGYYEEIHNRLSAGQTVYLARFLPRLESAYHLRSLGPLVEVGTTPLTTPPPIDYPLDVVFGESIRLLGFNAETLTMRHDKPLALTLFWEATAPTTANYHVRLLLVSAEGRVWWESERHPVNGLYPTAAWKPPEIIPDYYEITPDISVPPGDYRLKVGLFLPFAQQGLPIAETRENYLTLSTVHLETSPVLMAAYSSRARFGENWILLDYDHPAIALPGSKAEFVFVWQRLRPGSDFDLVLEMVNEDGQIISEVIPPFRGEYPPSRWPVGSCILDRQTITVPAIPGTYQVRVGLRTPAYALIPAQCGWLAPATQTCNLGYIRIQGSPVAAAGVTNFDGQILLLNAELGRQRLHAGETLPITLTWQAQRKMSEDYTLFIHLLDEQGQLQGQIDVWPRDGTYPTSLWVEGETFSETYAVPLDLDASPGQYQVEIGWYLLRTMQRLPVLDADGKIIDDKVLIYGLEVVSE